MQTLKGRLVKIYQEGEEVLKSKLKAGITIIAINTWAIPVVRYTAGIVDWSQAIRNSR